MGSKILRVSCLFFLPWPRDEFEGRSGGREIDRFFPPLSCCGEISTSTLRNGQLVFESKSAERALANYPFFPPQIDARAIELVIRTSGRGRRGEGPGSGVYHLLLNSRKRQPAARSLTRREEHGSSQEFRPGEFRARLFPRW